MKRKLPEPFGMIVGFFILGAAIIAIVLVGWLVSSVVFDKFGYDAGKIFLAAYGGAIILAFVAIINPDKALYDASPIVMKLRYLLNGWKLPHDK